MAAVLTLALLAGGAVAVALMSGEDADAVSTAATSGIDDAPARADAASAPASTPWDEDVAQPLPPVDVEACLTEISAGETAVGAAEVSAQQWDKHVQAQVDLDSGSNTREESLAIWAETHASGASDVAGFNAANDAYQQQAGGCERLAQATPTRDDVARCVDRATAVAAAVAAGDAVNQDWNAHLEMAAHKDRVDRYYEVWRASVAAAPTNLDAFTAARGALTTAAPCELRT